MVGSRTHKPPSPGDGGLWPQSLQTPAGSGEQEHVDGRSASWALSRPGSPVPERLWAGNKKGWKLLQV